MRLPYTAAVKAEAWLHGLIPSLNRSLLHIGPTPAPFSHQSRIINQVLANNRAVFFILATCPTGEFSLLSTQSSGKEAWRAKACAALCLPTLLLLVSVQGWWPQKKSSVLTFENGKGLSFIFPLQMIYSHKNSISIVEADHIWASLQGPSRGPYLNSFFIYSS